LMGCLCILCLYTLQITAFWIYCCTSLTYTWCCLTLESLTACFPSYTSTMKNPKSNSNTWVVISPSSTLTCPMDTDAANLQPASYWYHTGTQKLIFFFNQNPTQILKYKKLIPRTSWYLQNLIPEQHWS
jgi:hypothetical protein